MPTKQFLLSGTADDPATGATEYSSLLGDGDNIWQETEANRESVIPIAGKLSNFQAGVRIAPNAGKSWTFTIRKNNEDTDLSVVISNTSVISPLDTDEVAVAAGDKVAIKAVPSGTPTAAKAVYWTCQFTPDTDGETILLSNSGGINLGGYYTLIGAKPATGYEIRAQTLFPTAGTLKKFYVELTTAPGAGKSRTFTIRKNGEATSLVVTISNSATTGSDTDPAHNITIGAGDKVTIEDTSMGTPSYSKGKFGIGFLPDVQGEYIASATTEDYSPAVSTEYQHLNCGDSTLSDTEAKMHCLAQETLVKKIYVNLSAAQGEGKSYAFTLRRNLADTALTVTLSNATSGNVATDVAISADDLLTTKIVPTETPTIARSQIAYLLYNKPTAPPAPPAANPLIGKPLISADIIRKAKIR